jgi:archaeal type IV pilus assembly protein PilA
MKTIQKDEAVSPVIGVILMVAIVVILAAVIAAFVFGMAGNTQTARNVGLIASTNATDYGIFTVTGGSDLAALSNLTYILNGTAANQRSLQLGGAGGALSYPLKVGEATATLEAIKGSKVTVVGIFTDGATQILLERQF